MFIWLKQRLVKWVEDWQQREFERLYAENLRLKAEILKATGQPRIRLTPEQHERLNQARRGIDPERFKQIDLLSDAE